VFLRLSTTKAVVVQFDYPQGSAGTRPVENLIMAKPKPINVTQVEGIVTQGTCPICRVVFAHGGKIGEASKDQIPNMYAGHLKEKHP